MSDTKLKKQKKSGLKRRESRFGVALILPAVIVVLLLVILPLFWNIALSFQSARLINIQDVKLVGFDATLRNFERVLSDREFWPVLRTTFIYTIFGSILSIE